MGVIAIGDIGLGEVLLALVPTVNLLVIAVVWKLTGKTQTELVGKADEVVSSVDETSQMMSQILTRLKRLENVTNTLEKKLNAMHYIS